MMLFQIEKGTKQNLLAIYLNATNREYKVRDMGSKLIFTVKRPHFTQDEVLLNMFFNELVKL